MDPGGLKRGSILVFLWKQETKSTCDIFQVGSRLTSPSGSAHGQLGWVGGVKLTKALAFFFHFTEGIKLLLWRGGGAGSIPVFLWETRFLVFSMRGLETKIPFWVRVWAGGGQTDKIYHNFS